MIQIFELCEDRKSENVVLTIVKTRNNNSDSQQLIVGYTFNYEL